MKFFLIFLSLLLVIDSKFSAIGQRFILNNHNSLRYSFAVADYWTLELKHPPAANMVELKWSSELEESAQKYAESCRIPTLENNNLNFYNTTANFTDPPASDIAGLRASVHWASEFYEHGMPEETFTQEMVDAGISSATKMIWANVTAIGCGLNQCKTNLTDLETILHVVCQYNGNVNVIDQEIYKYGDICSACPNGMKCKYFSALCLEKNYYTHSS